MAASILGAMKKPSQKPRARSLELAAQDLAAIRGGDNGVIHMEHIGTGPLPADNGVVHSRD